jgi:hypothetical protein
MKWRLILVETVVRALDWPNLLLKVDQNVVRFRLIDLLNSEYGAEDDDQKAGGKRKLSPQQLSSAGSQRRLPIFPLASSQPNFPGQKFPTAHEFGYNNESLSTVLQRNVVEFRRI